VRGLGCEARTASHPKASISPCAVERQIEFDGKRGQGPVPTAGETGPPPFAADGAGWPAANPITITHAHREVHQILIATTPM
jgi:hypothetical protein